MNIYIASKFSSRERLIGPRQAIRDLGITCHSSWIDQPEGDYPSPEVYAATATGIVSKDAVVDLEQITAADLVILDTYEVDPNGGREFEIGFAYAGGIDFWRVGPRRHIFHDLAEYTFDTWAEAIAALKGSHPGPYSGDAE